MNSYAFCYVVLNAGDYLHYSFQNIAKLAGLHPNSGIVIVEAADQFAHTLEKTEKGLSVDDTHSIIKHWLANELPGRIAYDKLGHIKDKREARNRCLELARQHFDVSHIVNLEAHELIDIDDFLAIDDHITENINHLTFWLKKRTIWGDFKTRYADEDEIQHEKIIANCHNFEYSWWHTTISITNQPPFHISFRDSTGYLDYPFYNYGNIRPRDRLFMQRLHDRTEILWQNADLYSGKGEYGEKNQAWYEMNKGQPWQEEHWARTTEITKHPPEITQHPRFTLSKEEIWNSPELYPTYMP